MEIYGLNEFISMPNLLLIAGNGRNVGKTFLACEIIRLLSKNHEITGLKISPHFHNFNEKDVIFKNENYIVAEESHLNSKDSSMMLQAGSKKVYFVMAHQKHISEAFEKLKPLISDKILVCESGGLHEYVKPGLFLFVKRQDDEITKSHLLNYSPIIVNNNGSEFDFDIQKIEISNNNFHINKSGDG